MYYLNLIAKTLEINIFVLIGLTSDGVYNIYEDSASRQRETGDRGSSVS